MSSVTGKVVIEDMDDFEMHSQGTYLSELSDCHLKDIERNRRAAELVAAEDARLRKVSQHLAELVEAAGWNATWMAAEAARYARKVAAGEK